MIKNPTIPASGSTPSIDWVEETLAGEPSGKMVSYHLTVPLADMETSVVAYFLDIEGCVIAFKDGTNYIVNGRADATVEVSTTEDAIEITGVYMLGPETTRVMYLVV